MSERLGRIEASLERAEQRAEKRDEDIDTLLGAIASTDKQVQETGEQVRELRGENADAKQRFEVLRAEAQRDREEYRALFNDAIAQIEQRQEEWSKRFDSQQREWSQKFDNQQATIERLLLALLDRKEVQDRLAAKVAQLERRPEAS